jgi:hypothetical protein
MQHMSDAFQTMRVMYLRFRCRTLVEEKALRKGLTQSRPSDPKYHFDGNGTPRLQSHHRGGRPIPCAHWHTLPSLGPRPIPTQPESSVTPGPCLSFLFIQSSMIFSANPGFSGSQTTADKLKGKKKHSESTRRAGNVQHRDLSRVSLRTRSFVRTAVRCQ